MARGALRLAQTADAFTVSGKNFFVVFDSKAGLLNNYTYDKAVLLQNGPEPSFWRAPTDNDIGAGFNSSLRKWRNAYAEGKLVNASISHNSDGSYTVEFKKELINGEAVEEQLITIYADGTLKVVIALRR